MWRCFLRSLLGPASVLRQQYLARSVFRPATGKLYCCPNCDFTTETAAELYNHQQAAPCTTTVSPAIQPKESTRLIRDVAAVVTAEQTPAHTRGDCEHCPFRSLNASTLEAHHEKHNVKPAGQPFKFSYCRLCGSVTSSEFSMVSHIRKLHKCVT